MAATEPVPCHQDVAVPATVVPLPVPRPPVLYPLGFDGEAWVVRVPANAEFAAAAILALTATALARVPSHPSAGIFFHLIAAFQAAEQETLS